MPTSSGDKPDANRKVTPASVRVNLLTWLAFALVAFVVVVKQFQHNPEGWSIVNALGSSTSYYCGWPIAFERGTITHSWMEGDAFSPDEGTTRYRVEYRSAAFGALQATAVLVIALVGIYFFLEDRSLQSPMQVSVCGLLKFIVLLAIALALVGKEMLRL